MLRLCPACRFVLQCSQDKRGGSVGNGAGPSHQIAALPERRHTLDGLQLTHTIVDKLEEHQAADIVMLDLREITPLADYFVICTADSDRQARTLQEIIEEDLKKEQQVRPLSTEGEPASGWVLLDYNYVVVHIFSKTGRAFYRLEELWKAAPVVLKIQ